MKIRFSLPDVSRITSFLNKSADSLHKKNVLLKKEIKKDSLLNSYLSSFRFSTVITGLLPLFLMIFIFSSIFPALLSNINSSVGGNSSTGPIMDVFQMMVPLIAVGVVASVLLGLFR